MANLDQDIDDLRRFFRELEAANENVSTAKQRPPDFQADYLANYEAALDAARDRIVNNLQKRVVRYPYYHERHFRLLRDFHAAGKYEESVFIMTKFPDPGDPGAPQLQNVIDAVSEGIRANGLKPRIATTQYHPLLWDNVELHTLACCRGVAIVEDRYRPELNPNVAMEWGFMRALGKPVLFLIEKDFKHLR